MANLNKVFLIGRLTKDPELRHTQTGAAVSQVSIAVNRSYKTPEGEKKEVTCFVDVVLWGRQAEVACQYLSKGRTLFVEGRLEQDSWEAPDGQKRTKMRVVAENFQFLGDRGGDREGAPTGEDSPHGEFRSAPRREPPPPEGGPPEGGTSEEPPF
ncbi:MAG: single-stranded DNA-binding protein [Planctomycetota bacterium]